MSEKATRKLQVYLTPSQWKIIYKATDLVGSDYSNFVRSLILRESYRILDEHGGKNE